MKRPLPVDLNVDIDVLRSKAERNFDTLSTCGKLDAGASLSIAAKQQCEKNSPAATGEGTGKTETS